MELSLNGLNSILLAGFTTILKLIWKQLTTLRLVFKIKSFSDQFQSLSDPWSESSLYQHFENLTKFESTAELGIIEHIGLRKNGWNDWKVKEIIVDDETHEHGHLFEINQWIKQDEDYFFESVASTHEINDPAE